MILVTIGSYRPLPLDMIQMRIMMNKVFLISNKNSKLICNAIKSSIKELIITMCKTKLNPDIAVLSRKIIPLRAKINDL